MALEIDVLTLFPAMFEGPLAASIPGRIQERGLATVRVHDLRDWGLGRHRTVDDTTYGGGAGMVLRPEPVAAAFAALRRPDTLSILLDPTGDVFRQSRAVELAGREHLLLLCARYEGVDERIRSMVDLELSIGDYVLTGGELAALVVIDSVIRLLPGAIDEASTAEESFTHGLLEYPQYTRPPSFDGTDVPADPRLRRPRRRAPLAPQGVAAPDAGAPPRPARRPAGEPRGAAPARRARPGRGRVGRPRLGRVLYSAVGRPRGPLPTQIPQSRLPTTVRNRNVNVLDEIVKDQLRTDLPEIATGDTVKVSARVVEGNRERIQVFEGTVMRLRGGGITRTITVRRIASGVGVERTFKINSPRIDKIEVVRHGVARRAQLYFLRKRVGKAATLRERRSNS